MSELASWKMPEKLAFLLGEAARYKIIRGGRGSGKSWSVARALLIRGYEQKKRILCTREIQKSIKQSVHKLLKDQVSGMGLEAEYRVLEQELRGANGTEFAFSGLSDQTVDSIKSFEGCDIVWIEEGQTISDRSLEILIPTIRKDGSEIWITYNPELETDPVHKRFVVDAPDDCISIEMNYEDNPWFPEVLEKERLRDKARLPESKYNHIWRGMCLPAVEGAIYFDEVSAAKSEGRIRPVPIDPLLKVHAVWDLGWNDSMSIILVQRSASELRIVDYIEDSHRTLTDYILDLKAMRVDWGNDYLPHDGFTKDFKTGKTAQEILEAHGRTVEQTPNIDVESGIKAAREVFSRVYFNEDKAGRLIECLKRYRRRINQATKEADGPLHDEYSHGADAFRYLALNADQMSNAAKLQKITYPNRRTA